MCVGVGAWVRGCVGVGVGGCGWVWVGVYVTRFLSIYLLYSYKSTNTDVEERKNRPDRQGQDASRCRVDEAARCESSAGAAGSDRRY